MRPSTPTYFTSPNWKNNIPGPNLHPTPLMEVSVPFPPVPKCTSDHPQIKVPLTSSPTQTLISTHIPTDTTSFFRRAEGFEITYVADATNSEYAYAKHHESDVASTDLPKISPLSKPNVLANSHLITRSKQFV